jgi:molybdopterin synthase sulfur carrier subunit
MAMVTIRYWAAAKDAAGVAAESLEAGTLADALVAALDSRGRERGNRLRGILDRSSFLIDGRPSSKSCRRSPAVSHGGRWPCRTLTPAGTSPAGREPQRASGMTGSRVLAPVGFRY